MVMITLCLIISKISLTVEGSHVYPNLPDIVIYSLKVKCLSIVSHGVVVIDDNKVSV